MRLSNVSNIHMRLYEAPGSTKTTKLLNDRSLQVFAPEFTVNAVKVVGSRPDVINGTFGNVVFRIVVLFAKLKQDHQYHFKKRCEISMRLTFKASTKSWQGTTLIAANRFVKSIFSLISVVSPFTLMVKKLAAHPEPNE